MMMMNVFVLFANQTIHEIKHHHRRIAIFVWEMLAKIAKQMFPKTWYLAQTVGAPAIHHAFNSHQT